MPGCTQTTEKAVTSVKEKDTYTHSILAQKDTGLFPLLLFASKHHIFHEVCTTGMGFFRCGKDYPKPTPIKGGSKTFTSDSGKNFGQF